jgi:hypothetical protein
MDTWPNSRPANPHGELRDFVVDCLDGTELVLSVTLWEDEEPALWKGLG